jgi:hypothetical protein
LGKVTLLAVQLQIMLPPCAYHGTGKLWYS